MYQLFIGLGNPREYLTIKLKIGVLIKFGINCISGRNTLTLKAPKMEAVVGWANDCTNLVALSKCFILKICLLCSFIKLALKLCGSKFKLVVLLLCFLLRLCSKDVLRANAPSKPIVKP